ncbi:MAG TPA: hypothetical protein DIW47_06330 [Bacteroidetes bacterium]|nr:hypothetical protein [Bacteroidota bacterium]
MNSVELIGYIQQLLTTRQIKDYYLDLFTLVMPPTQNRLYTQSDRGFYYLLTSQLPVGTRIASETSILEVDATWENKGITKIQEFGGQLVIWTPDPGQINELEFIRVIPRS